jgi:hypothetical protein
MENTGVKGHLGPIRFSGERKGIRKKTQGREPHASVSPPGDRRIFWRGGPIDDLGLPSFFIFNQLKSNTTDRVQSPTNR